MQAEGRPDQLIAKAQRCVAAKVSNTSVTVGRSGGGGLLDAMSGLHRAQNPGADVPQLIELVDSTNGLLVANSVTDYRHSMFAYIMKSRLTLEAREGRFRISHTDLQSMQKDGSSAQASYGPIVKAWGMGWEPAISSVIEVSKGIEVCMQQNGSGDW